jgi:hypothetical protein
MDKTILWRAAATQLAAVAVLSTALALALPRDFFEDWGWLTGPTSWLLCAAFTSRALALPLGRVLLGAVLAGLPSILFVLIGLHWASALFAIAIFAVWCARLPQRSVSRPWERHPTNRPE